MNNQLYIFCGIPFSGKSNLAKQIERTLGYKRIDLDEVKFDVFGKEAKDSEINQEGWDKLYQEMYRQIEENLVKGETVIHDTGNFTKYERGLVKKIADKLKIETITVLVDTPKEIARERLIHNRQTNQRFDVSDDDFEATVKEMEAPDENEKHIVYHHDTPVDIWIKETFEK